MKHLEGGRVAVFDQAALSRKGMQVNVMRKSSPELECKLWIGAASSFLFDMYYIFYYN